MSVPLGFAAYSSETSLKKGISFHFFMQYVKIGCLRTLAPDPRPAGSTFEPDPGAAPEQGAAPDPGKNAKKKLWVWDFVCIFVTESII